MTILEDVEYLCDLAERLMHVPVMYGTDDSDYHQLREIAQRLKSPPVVPDRGRPIPASEAFPGWDAMHPYDQHRILDRLVSGERAWEIARQRGADPAHVQMLRNADDELRDGYRVDVRRRP